jgi:hypothetical protein
MYFLFAFGRDVGILTLSVVVAAFANRSGCVVCSQPDDTDVMQLRYTIPGNEAHRAPEVVGALRPLYVHCATVLWYICGRCVVCSAGRVVRRGAEFVPVDLGGQAVFEAGVLLWEMAFRRYPISAFYPSSLDARGYGGGGDGDTCWLTADEVTAATAVGYPVQLFTKLVRDMVAMHPHERPALPDARMRFEAMIC